MLFPGVVVWIYVSSHLFGNFEVRFPFPIIVANVFCSEDVGLWCWWILKIAIAFDLQYLILSVKCNFPKVMLQLPQSDVEILMPLQTPVCHHTTLRIEDADVTFGWNVEHPCKCETKSWCHRERWSQGAFPGVDRGQTRLPIDSWSQIPMWMSACFIHESLAAFRFHSQRNFLMRTCHWTTTIW